VRLRDLERHLAAQGCRKIREGARHTIWASGEDRSQRAPVPRHREIDLVIRRYSSNHGYCSQRGAVWRRGERNPRVQVEYPDADFRALDAGG
jgi:hypothetical protein